MRTLKWVAISLCVIYALVIGGLALGQRALLYFPDPNIVNPAEQATPGISVVTFKTSDGETLRAWWRPPADGKPVFLYLGGQADRLHRQGLRYSAMSQAGAGFLFLAYRGYAGSTGEPSEEGLHLDSLAAYEWLRARYDPARIVVHGFSLGSGVAVRLAAERPARALILEAPFTAAVDVAAERFPLAPVHLLMTDQFASRERIKAVKAPILIVNGTRDRIIPDRQGRTLFALAPSPKAYQSVDGAGHNNLAKYGLYNHIWRFLGVSATTETEQRQAAAPKARVTTF